MRWSIPSAFSTTPLSIAGALQRILDGTPVQREELLQVGELHVHLQFHGSFSRRDPEEALGLMNRAIADANQKLRQASHLVLTWGSAHIYHHRSREVVAANCHRIPAKEFEQLFLPPDRITEAMEAILRSLWSFRPELQVVLTVSPVRYLKEGTTRNTKSKASLLLAALDLTERHGRVHYFPSYEMVVDDLRDYRFYESDLIHPSAMAHTYIQEAIQEKWLDGETRALFGTLASIRRDLDHRPHSPDSESYARFLEQLKGRIDAIWKEHPELRMERAIQRWEENLEKVAKEEKSGGS